MDDPDQLQEINRSVIAELRPDGRPGGRLLTRTCLCRPSEARTPAPNTPIRAHTWIMTVGCWW
jgi:hypothetical protein